MLCPSCGRLLNKIDVVTREGGKFQVDHCGYCGGTWFDPYEINRIPFHEVAALAAVTVLPNNRIKAKTQNLCPNDHLPLSNFKGEAVPANVRLLWCNKCLGIWATQKDLLEFKKHQEETVSAYDQGNKFFPSLSVVFVPAMTFLFLLLATFTTISSLQEAREQRIMAESRISALITTPLSDGSVLISFNTSIPVKSYLSYGLTTLEMTETVISQNPEVTHNVILKNIREGEMYVYRIRITDSNGKSFTTDLKTF